MAIGDKMVLVLRAHKFGELIGLNDYNNVFAYENTSGAGTTGDLASSFFDAVLTPLRAVISEATVFDDAYCYNLDNLADFIIEPYGVDGDVPGEHMPQFVGWQFRYIRTTREVNDGRKTFGLVSEASVANGLATASALVLLNTLETALNNQIAGTLGSYAPRIWRRAGNYAPYTGTPPVGTPYPDTFYPVGGVNYQQVSTQNSRKR